MHQAWSADDITAIHLTDALVAEADAQNRGRRAKVLDHSAGDTSFVWRAGAWRYANARGLERLDFLQGHGIVADDFHFCTELAEVLYEVVGEGIVVVDDEQHGLSGMMREFEREQWP